MMARNMYSNKKYPVVTACKIYSRSSLLTLLLIIYWYYYYWYY